MTRRSVFALVLVLSVALSARAAGDLETLHGTCRVAPGTEQGTVQFDFRQGSCGTNEHCGHDHTGIPISRLSGLSLSDFARDGASVNAALTEEAGTLACSGVIHDSVLAGNFTFTPDAHFVERMRELDITGLDSEKLEVYTIFGIKSSWVKALQDAGVRGMTQDNVIALHIFKAEPGYVKSLSDLGYRDLDADKLIAMRVHKVDPSEVRQLRALGYEPTLDELVQMRIFRVTPDFIERMRKKGFKDLTISRLVQIKIFKLAD